ncbi:MAG: hypothetical protein KGJ23_05765 [Euryarchaeota archaeon]|nr:hypothetical protein [Euryarchaeota archaeon]MDE1836105.1 hypothetical protein [Euryarchaeota archaeon]MDE1879395.1 hypothetical protein [Euryarchaeota archaeon]MDE2044083.1 hypothetical protein [Thermoplasmata archaeon]
MRLSPRAVVVFVALASLVVSTWALTPYLPVSAASGTLDELASSHGVLPSWQAARAMHLSVTDPLGLLGYDAATVEGLSNERALASSTPETLGIALIPRDPAGLQQLDLAVNEPGSPLLGHYLTPQQYQERFAPTVAAEQQVEQILRAGGFTVTYASADRSFVQVEGTAGAANALFSTELVAGTYQGRSEVVPSTAPTLPSSLSPYVLSVTGLEVNVAPFSFAPLWSHAITPSSSSTCLLTCSTIYPDWTHFMYDLDKLYNNTASAGPHFAQTSTIGILLWGGSYGGFSPNDIQQYAQGLYWGPPFTYTPYPIDGAAPPGPNAPSDPSLAPMELTLDMEWSESQAPGASLDVVYVPEGTAANNYSPNPVELEHGIAVLVNLSGLTVITQSFGAPEGDQAFQSFFDAEFVHAGALGISVFAASGDDGGSTGSISNGCTQNPQVDYPAASPYATAVGGTAPTVNASGGGGPSGTVGVDTESAWQFSGGGYSTSYGLPPWQRGGSAYATIMTATSNAGARGVPDVAGPAADNAFVYNGALQGGEGTSFASPFWAGLTAEMVAVRGGALLGWLNPRLYALGAAQDQGSLTPAPYREILQGQNPGMAASCLYYAQPGWDAVTGYGAPKDAFNLYADLVANYIDLNITFNPDTASPGSTVTVRVAATNSTNGQPFTSGTIDLRIFSLPQTLKSTPLLTETQVALNSQGTGSFSYSIDLFYKYGHLLAQAEIFSAHSVGSTSSILTVTLLGSWYQAIQPLLAPPWNYLFFALIMGLATALGWVLGLRAPRPIGSPSPLRRLLPVRRRAPVRGPTPGPPVPVSYAGGLGGPRRPSVAARPGPGGPPRRGPGQRPATPRPSGGPATAAQRARPPTAPSGAPTGAPRSMERPAPGTEAQVAPGVTMVVPPKPSPAPPSPVETSSETPPAPSPTAASDAPAVPLPEDATAPPPAATEGSAGTATATPPEVPPEAVASEAETSPLPQTRERAPEEAGAARPPPESGPVAEGVAASESTAPAAPTEEEMAASLASMQAQAQDEAAPAPSAAPEEAAPAAEPREASSLPSPEVPETPPSEPPSEPAPAPPVAPAVPTEPLPPTLPEPEVAPPPPPAPLQISPEAAPAPRRPRVRKVQRPVVAAAAPPAPVVPAVSRPPPSPAPPVAVPASVVKAPREGLVARVEGDVEKLEKKVSRAVRRPKATCPRCGKGVSASAKSCPSCHAPLGG